MPKPAGNAPLDQSVPPSVVLATTPAVQSFTPRRSLVPIATQSVAVAQASDSIDSAGGNEESRKLIPPSLVDRNVASIGVPLGSADVATSPAQNEDDGQTRV